MNDGYDDKQMINYRQQTTLVLRGYRERLWIRLLKQFQTIHTIKPLLENIPIKPKEIHKKLNGNDWKIEGKHTVLRFVGMFLSIIKYKARH